MIKLDILLSKVTYLSGVTQRRQVFFDVLHGADLMDGDAGNDDIVGGAGVDSADGGPNTDTCDAEIEINCEA